MSLKDLDYDLCETCYQSISDEEKKLYNDSTVDPLTQYITVAATCLGYVLVVLFSYCLAYRGSETNI